MTGSLGSAPGQSGVQKNRVEATEALGTVVRIAEVAAIAEREVGAGLARIGISFSDLRLLMLLDRYEDLGIGRAELARARSLPISQSVRETRPLEKLGWVQRASNGNFALTESGRALAVEGADIASAIAAGWLAGPIDRTAELARMLGELVRETSFTA